MRDRRAILTALAGGCLSLAVVGKRARIHVMSDFFEFGRYQFILFEPQPDLPAVRLFYVDGSTILLPTVLGSPILRNFSATWCPLSRTELPILDRLQSRHGVSAIKLRAVSVDQTDRSRSHAPSQCFD